VPFKLQKAHNAYRYYISLQHLLHLLMPPEVVTHLAACTLFLRAHFHHLRHLHRPHSWLTATAMP
jgi:hypothetical protein